MQGCVSPGIHAGSRALSERLKVLVLRSNPQHQHEGRSETARPPRSSMKRCAPCRAVPPRRSRSPRVSSRVCRRGRHRAARWFAQPCCVRSKPAALRRVISHGSLDDDLYELVDAINRRREMIATATRRHRWLGSCSLRASVSTAGSSSSASGARPAPCTSSTAELLDQVVGRFLHVTFGVRPRSSSGPECLERRDNPAWRRR